MLNRDVYHVLKTMQMSDTEINNTDTNVFIIPSSQLSNLNYAAHYGIYFSFVLLFCISLMFCVGCCYCCFKSDDSKNDKKMSVFLVFVVLRITQ